MRRILNSRLTRISLPNLPLWLGGLSSMDSPRALRSRTQSCTADHTHRSQMDAPRRLAQMPSIASLASFVSSRLSTRLCPSNCKRVTHWEFRVKWMGRRLINNLRDYLCRLALFNMRILFVLSTLVLISCKSLADLTNFEVFSGL